MSLTTECGYRDPREFRFTAAVPIAGNPVPLFSTGGAPNKSVIAHLVGAEWAEKIAGILAIKGVSAVEVHRYMVIVFKETDRPWDDIDPAVHALLPT